MYPLHLPSIFFLGSSEAIYAYQKALDLKPNYMRAWTNMGISLANLGDYDRYG